MNLPRLCIFARVPRLGRVKSRLAAELGEPAALDAHIDLVDDTLQRLGAVRGCVSELWLDGDPDAACLAWAAGFGLPLKRQAEGDLGVRMHDALSQGLAAAPAALLVGTDCPDIDAAYVERALAALHTVDVVLGPAADGGYGLIGLRRPVPELFRSLPWGTDQVLELTLRAAAAAGLQIRLLPEIWDVDTAADWRRYLTLRGRHVPARRADPRPQ